MRHHDTDWPHGQTTRESSVGGGTRLGRRDFLAASMGAFAVAAFVPGVLLSRQRRLLRRSIPVMGTVAQIAIVHRGDPERAWATADAAFEELRRVDRTMSRFREQSDVGRANLRAYREPVAVEPATAHVIGQGLRWAEASDGRFDPCLGGAVALWDVKHRSRPPPSEEVGRWAGRALYRRLRLERSQDRSRVRYTHPDVRLDLGGIAKGYGVDRAVAALRDRGVRDALVNAGGDLYALGTSPDGDAWKIGVRSPVDPTRIVTSIRLRDRGIATSGDYEAHFTDGGRRYHHLLDPHTGAPRRTSVHTVTVTAETCLAADAAATAAFGAEPDAARRLLAKVETGADLIRPRIHPKEESA